MSKIRCLILDFFVSCVTFSGTKLRILLFINMLKCANSVTQSVTQV